MVVPRLPSVSSCVAVAIAAGGLLSGCVSAAVGAGAAVGIAAYQERGLSGRVRDLKIAMDVRERLFSHNHELIADVGVSVYEGRVMLTGRVKDEQLRADAVRLAWSAPGVRDVINEIAVADEGLIDRSRDLWITAKLETRINLDKDVDAVNYNVTTVDNTVYLIGIAQDQDELDRVIAHARDLSHVRGVVNHVRVKSETVSGLPETPGGS